MARLWIKSFVAEFHGHVTQTRCITAVISQLIATTVSLLILSGSPVSLRTNRFVVRPNHEIRSRFGSANENLPPIKVLRYRVRDLDREYEISNLEIRNSSSQTIQQVEFTWVVVSREGGNMVSRDGLSFVRRFPNSLRPHETAKLPFVVARVPKILMGSVNNGTLGLVVSDVIFADGIHWKKPPYHRL